MHQRQPDTRPTNQQHRGISLLEDEYAATNDPQKRAELRDEIRKAGYPVIADELDETARSGE